MIVTDKPRPGALLRQLGLVSATALVVSNMIGTGIFTSLGFQIGDLPTGFSIMALSWVEAVGYCQPGEAGPFLAKHWSAGENRVLIDGRVPINTHGGSLSEGATQGAGHFREAVTQLRGDAGERQVPGAATALVTPGGFLWNATGFVLRGG